VSRECQGWIETCTYALQARLTEVTTPARSGGHPSVTNQQPSKPQEPWHLQANTSLVPSLPTIVQAVSSTALFIIQTSKRTAHTIKTVHNSPIHVPHVPPQSATRNWLVIGPRPMRQRQYSLHCHRLPKSYPHRVIPPPLRRQLPQSAHSRITQVRPRPHRHRRPALPYTTSPSFSPCPPDILEQHSSSSVTLWSARSHPFSTIYGGTTLSLCRRRFTRTHLHLE